MSSSHHTVAHNWANRTGKCLNGFNMFHDNETIFSYSSHFPIARHIDGVVLFTTESYSTSTSKHIGIVGSACHHLTQFNVPDVRATGIAAHKRNAESFKKRFNAVLESAVRRRSAELMQWDIDSAERLAASYLAYCKHFGFRRAPLRILNLDSLKETMKVKAEKQRKAAEKLAEKRRIAQAIEFERVRTELVPAWQNGDSTVRLPYDYEPTLCRVVRNESGDYIETSKRAIFPVADAIAEFPRLLAMAAESAANNGANISPNPTNIPRPSIKLGNFRIDYVNDKGIKAGCHWMEWRIVLRTARQVGFKFDASSFRAAVDSLETESI